MVQAALFQLVRDRKCGEYELPEGASLMACGNRESDRGVTHRMPTPLASRFVHLEIKVDPSDWCEWGAANGIAPETLFFIQLRPELLHRFDPQSREAAFACPRTWEFVSNVVNQRGSLDPAAERALFRGAVGEAAAVEFSAFLRVWRELPHPRAVIDDPENADVPENASALIALCGSLYRMADDINLGSIVSYAMSSGARWVSSSSAPACAASPRSSTPTPSSAGPLPAPGDPLPIRENPLMNLTHDAMLVSLRITAWFRPALRPPGLQPRRGPTTTRPPAPGATTSGCCPKAAFAALTATVSEARAQHYANSLPWDDQGSRLLTVANYEAYTELMDGLRERMVRERARFIEDYDDNVDRARLDLGKLFRIGDYPSKEALQGKFGIRYRIVPVPDADHFMAKLASHDTERVKRGIEREIEERLHDAVGDLYRRLGEAVERVSERLTEDGEGKPLVFRDTMISNVRDLVDVVPRLNIFGDDRLAQLCQDVKDRIAQADPATLRPSPNFNPNVRRQVKCDADALMEKFAGYFGTPAVDRKAA